MEILHYFLHCIDNSITEKDAQVEFDVCRMSKHTHSFYSCCFQLEMIDFPVNKSPFCYIMEWFLIIFLNITIITVTRAVQYNDSKKNKTKKKTSVSYFECTMKCLLCTAPTITQLQCSQSWLRVGKGLRVSAAFWLKLTSKAGVNSPPKNLILLIKVLDLWKYLWFLITLIQGCMI